MWGWLVRVFGRRGARSGGAAASRAAARRAAAQALGRLLRSQRSDKLRRIKDLMEEYRRTEPGAARDAIVRALRALREEVADLTRQINAL